MPRICHKPTKTALVNSEYSELIKACSSIAPLYAVTSACRKVECDNLEIAVDSYVNSNEPRYFQNRITSASLQSNLPANADAIYTFTYAYEDDPQNGQVIYLTSKDKLSYLFVVTDKRGTGRMKARCLDKSHLPAAADLVGYYFTPITAFPDDFDVDIAREEGVEYKEAFTKPIARDYIKSTVNKCFPYFKFIGLRSDRLIKQRLISSIASAFEIEHLKDVNRCLYNCKGALESLFGVSTYHRNISVDYSQQEPGKYKTTWFNAFDDIISKGATAKDWCIFCHPELYKAFLQIFPSATRLTFNGAPSLCVCYAGLNFYVFHDINLVGMDSKPTAIAFAPKYITKYVHTPLNITAQSGDILVEERSFLHLDSPAALFVISGNLQTPPHITKPEDTKPEDENGDGEPV